MTKEELYIDRMNVIREIFAGRGTFTVPSAPHEPMMFSYDKYTVFVKCAEGFGTLAALQLIQKVVDDLEQELQQLKIEDNAPAGRALRKVTIHGRRKGNRSCAKAT